MIFRPELARLVRAGKKTQTRRPVKPGQVKAAYSPGKTYAIQEGRGKPENGRILVLAVRREPVGDITFEDARAEGFKTRAAFAAYWLRLHDHAWLERQGDDLDDALVMARFEQQHAFKLVWVYSFHVVRDQLRLLHKDSSHGYTNNPSNALPDEPEAVPAADQARITKDAGRRYASEHRDELARRRARSITSQISEAERRARQRGIDIEDELATLREGLDGMLRKLGSAA